MGYGWMGTTLEIDLTQGTIEKKETAPELSKAYLGGKGTNARIFWDRVPPEIDAFSADNLLIISPGVLTGTMVPSANKGVITFKSPATGSHYHSSLGGFWPAAIKHAGYDTIIIRGKSPTPVYLWIDNDKVELRDAAHLWGKGTYEARKAIAEELDNSEVEVACIGPAGESKCYVASIETSFAASASRGGPGAVMGDKNLKAIAVYGTSDVNIARPLRLAELGQQILDRAGSYKEMMDHAGLARGVGYGETKVGYFGNMNEMYEDLPPDSEFRQEIDALQEGITDWIDKADTAASCYGCGVKCRHGFPLPGGGHYYLKCGSWCQFKTAFRIIDFDFDMECGRLCQHYGFDIWSASRSIAFAIDLYEKGILTKQDTGGMHLEWGNKEVVFSLMEKMSRREGIGDILANGVYEAARQIGRGAEEFAHHTKKLEYIGPTALLYRPYNALTQAISDKADFTRLSSSGIGTPSDSLEERQAFTEAPHWIYPEEYKKYYLAEDSPDGADYEAACQFAAYDDETYTILDMTGICSFWSIFLPYPSVNSRALMADLVTCVTGMDTSEAELTVMARRTLNLVRSLNLRSGLRRKDDTLAKVFFQGTTASPERKLDPDLFNKWIDRYYELKGWDSQGIPTKETLQGLELDYVGQDLERREILHGVKDEGFEPRKDS
ncbi:MAG: aldehyde ferredoxin oxidoreductase N-terminal domain-containing protein [Dehalococcoidia bacterium]